MFFGECSVCWFPLTCCLPFSVFLPFHLLFFSSLLSFRMFGVILLSCRGFEALFCQAAEAWIKAVEANNWASFLNAIETVVANTKSCEYASLYEFSHVECVCVWECVCVCVRAHVYMYMFMRIFHLRGQSTAASLRSALPPARPCLTQLIARSAQLVFGLVPPNSHRCQ